jgi:hypothetical protein
MTRQQALEYIIATHGDDLQEAGVELTDTPENLYFVLYDSMTYESVSDARQQAEADAKVARLIADKTAGS